MGLDGMSIWAAATSGKRAIAIHLLACTLSKIWKGPKSISVWVKLLARRKSEILAEFDGGSTQATARIMAAQQEITRGHLAAWDASARAWLQTADEAIGFVKRFGYGGNLSIWYAAICARWGGITCTVCVAFTSPYAGLGLEHWPR